MPFCLPLPSHRYAKFFLTFSVKKNAVKATQTSHHLMYWDPPSPKSTEKNPGESIPKNYLVRKWDRWGLIITFIWCFWSTYSISNGTKRYVCSAHHLTFTSQSLSHANCKSNLNTPPPATKFPFTSSVKSFLFRRNSRNFSLVVGVDEEYSSVDEMVYCYKSMISKRHFKSRFCEVTHESSLCLYYANTYISGESRGFVAQ